MRIVFARFVTFYFMFTFAESLYLAGHLHTKTSWEFLGRFCFLSDLGRLQFKFTYPYKECCHNLLLYYDTNGQWSEVYKNDSMNCQEKEMVLFPQDHQIINLTTRYTWSGCKVTNKTGEKTLECSAGRSFRTVRERWWYIVISNCQAGSQGRAIDVQYEMKLTNGHSFWTEQFSADEFGILETNIAFFIIYTLMLSNALRAAVELANRQMLHTTYKMFLITLGIETFGLLLLCVAIGTFAADGVGNDGIRILGEIFGASSELGFLLMLLLVGKGYTITRGQLSHAGSIKLAVFSTIYGAISIVLFMYEYVFSDPGLVLYVYESPAGHGLLALRMTAWLWFTYGVIFTVKHYPEKSGFYYRLYILYSIWFFAVPIMVLISSFAIPKYMRSKVVTALELCIDFLAYFVFMILTRPGAANKNFPYHVRTSQIGIIKPDGKMETMVDFPHSVYGESDLEPNGRRMSNFVDLFAVRGPLENGSGALCGRRRNDDQGRENSDANYPRQQSGIVTTTLAEAKTDKLPQYQEITQQRQPPRDSHRSVELFASSNVTSVTMNG